MATIHKYKVEPKRELQKIMVPAGTRLISAIEQNGEIMVYGLIEKPHENMSNNCERQILVVGTGWNFDIEGAFNTSVIGTVKVGPFVWHVLEVDDLPF